MANLKSSKKDIRRIRKKTAANRVIKSRLKTLRRRLNENQAAGEKESTSESARIFISALDKATKRGVIHQNKANRLKSRTARQLATPTE